MDRQLNEVLGVNRFDNYSLSDGISAVSNKGTTYEFKMATDKNFVKNVNKALDKADCAIIITQSSQRRINSYIQNVKGKDIIVINLSKGNLFEGAYNNRTPLTEVRGSLVKSTGSQLNLENESLNLIKNLIQELPDVNSNNQQLMDYSLYKNGKVVFNKESDIRYSNEIEEPTTEEKGDIFDINNINSLVNRQVNSWKDLDNEDIRQIINKGYYGPSSILDEHLDIQEVIK